MSPHHPYSRWSSVSKVFMCWPNTLEVGREGQAQLSMPCFVACVVWRSYTYTGVLINVMRKLWAEITFEETSLNSQCSRYVLYVYYFIRRENTWVDVERIKLLNINYLRNYLLCDIVNAITSLYKDITQAYLIDFNRVQSTDLCHNLSWRLKYNEWT